MFFPKIILAAHFSNTIHRILKNMREINSNKVNSKKKKEKNVNETFNILFQ